MGDGCPIVGILRMAETFDVDGRTVVIQFNFKVKNPEMWIETILNVCQKNHSARAIPKIFFYVEKAGGSHENTNGWVNVFQIEEGIYNIHLNGDFFQRLSTENFYYELSETLTHELTHLWQDFISLRVQKDLATNKRLIKSLEGKETTIINSQNFEEIRSIQTIRILLSFFFRNLSVEGLATYCEEELSEKIEFSSIEFTRLYFFAEKEVNRIIRIFNEILAKRFDFPDSKSAFLDLYVDLKGGYYDIGLHMVFTIMYVDKRTTEDIAKMSPFEFVKEYESCMVEKGEKPVVSATSGKGILDYKKLVGEWAAMIKMKRKKS